jgi:FtsZ-binding cell division protein ZapB
MDIIIYLNITSSNKTEFLEVQRVADTIEASLTLGTVANKSVKSYYPDHSHTVFELPDSDKLSEILKDNEIALVWNEEKTRLAIHKLEDSVYNGIFYSTPVKVVKNIGSVEYSRIASQTSIYPDLANTIANLEAQLKEEKTLISYLNHNLKEAQTKIEESTSHLDLLRMEIFEVLQENRDIKDEFADKLAELRDALSKTSESLQIRSDDCKRLVIENARLRDVDDKNFMTIMMLNQEIEKLRSAKKEGSVSVTRPSPQEFRVSKKEISPRDVDKKPIQRVTQETHDESSYDACIKIIKGFDRTKLKSSQRLRV